MAQLGKLPRALHPTAYVTGTRRDEALLRGVIGLHADGIPGENGTSSRQGAYYGTSTGRWTAGRSHSFSSPTSDQGGVWPKMPPTPFHHIALRVDR